MKNLIAKIICGLALIISITPLCYAQFIAPVNSVDPYIWVTNDSNQAYTMKFQGATVDSMANGLNLDVKNQGVANIPAHSKRKLAAHFNTLSQDKQAHERSHLFYIALYNKKDQKVNEVQIVQHTLQQKCSIMVENTEVIINKNGLMTLIFNHPTQN